jgi:hypothetical protein
MKINKMNKKSMSISVLLLVMLTIILIGASIIIFIVKDKNISSSMDLSNNIDRTHIKEVKLNYYLNEIFDNSVKEFKFEQGKDVLISNLKKELNKHKTTSGYYYTEGLEQVESQLNNVDLTKEKISLLLNFNIKSNNSELNIDYNFNTKLEKIFKV